MSRRHLILLVPFVALAATSVAFAEPDLDLVQQWIAQDSPGPKWRECPRAAYTQGDPTTGKNPSEARNPFFGFGIMSPTFRCLQSGPYDHGGEQWWVQLVSNVEGTDIYENMLVDAVRVCSPSRVVPPAAATVINKPGPCVAGTGKRGCAVCALVATPAS